MLTLTADKLPEGAFVLRFTLEERLAAPLCAVVHIRTDDTAFEPRALIGEQATLRIDGPHARIVDGVVSEASVDGLVDEQLLVSVTLSAALGALQHRRAHRHFQHMSVVDVAKQVFEGAGFAERVEWRLRGGYAPRALFVQYGETELDFVSRLFEEHGLFYFFTHPADGHRMVIGDHPDAFEIDAPPLLAVASAVGDAIPLERFSRKRSLRPNHVHARDYNCERPEPYPEGVASCGEAYPLPQFLYPGRFADDAYGQMIAEARLRSLRHDADLARGRLPAAMPPPGHAIVVDGALEPCLNGGFIVTELRSHGSQDAAASTISSEFSAVAANTPWGPPQRTPKPRARGVETAVITGPEQGEQQIHCDGLGRVKVRFFWDRESPKDDTSSPWLRFSQAMLGGSMFLPRVGWEISVGYGDGDPSRPLGLGRVYNGEIKPPAGLPAAKASGSLESYSSPGGGGRNAIGMSDTAGTQGLSIDAQRNLTISAGNDWLQDVVNEETVHVHVNREVTVGGNASLEVSSEQTIQVGAVLARTVSGNQSFDVAGADTKNATANVVERVAIDSAHKTGGDATLICNGIRQMVGGNFTQTVGGTQIDGSIASINESVLGNDTEDVGAVTVHLCLGSHSETVGGNKRQVSTAAELHITKGNHETTAGGAINHIVGAVSFNKIADNYVVKAPLIALTGATATLTVGKTSLKLGGGPLVAKTPKLGIDSAMIVKTATSLKMGS